LPVAILIEPEGEDVDEEKIESGYIAIMRVM